jgi:hypothetical protein
VLSCECDDHRHFPNPGVFCVHLGENIPWVVACVKHKKSHAAEFL